MARFTWLLRRLVDPAVESRSHWRAGYAAFEAGPLRVCRLEERRVLAADLLADSPHQDAGVLAAFAGGDVSPSSVPVVTMPGNQATTEGAPLLFSPATGREIRIDAPGLGAGPLVVQITAIEAQGQVTPSLSFGSTAGLTVTGNGVNSFQLQGSLPDINAALSHITFYAIDDGDFTISVTATDPATGDNDGQSLQVQVSNVAPQVQVGASNSHIEGSNIELPFQLTDPGPLDVPQATWSVSLEGALVASGAGTSVQFFAANDGAYDLQITAFDEDGGVNSVHQQVAVVNADPKFLLTGYLQNGAAHLSVVISDPGYELFSVQVLWTQAGTTSETFFTSAYTFELHHRYTPEELDFDASDLTISVIVSDNGGIDQQTLNFREGETPQVERPQFDSPPEQLPPERTVAPRQQPGSSTSQIASPDLGRVVTPDAQIAPALHQFVLRVVGPDGQESESFPLSPEALINLPAFLTSLGVPDGHYRVYLLTGDLERLVIDGHLRAGRIVDPTEESQLAFDAAPSTDAAGQAINMESSNNVQLVTTASLPVAARYDTQCDLHAAADDSSHDVQDRNDEENIDAPLPANVHDAAPEFAPPPAVVASADSEDTASTTSREEPDSDYRLAATVCTTAIVVVAATAVSPQWLRSSTAHALSPTAFRRFTKAARLARKIAKSHLTAARQ